MSSSTDCSKSTTHSNYSWVARNEQAGLIPQRRVGMFAGSWTMNCLEMVTRIGDGAS